MELGDLVRALRARWWLLVGGLVLGGATALAATLMTTPLYTASMQFFVSTRDSTSTAEAFQGSQFSQQRVTSYAHLLTGEELAARVVEQLNIAISPEQLAERVTATAVAQTVLIDVTVSDTSPQRAQRIAEVMADEFGQLVSELEATDASASSPVRVSLADPPDVPVAPSSPQVARNIALGLLAGLLLGAGAAVVRARMDQSVRDPEDILALAGAAVIGTVLRDGTLERRHVVDRIGANRAAEDYRQLRNNLQFLDVDAPPRVIVVSSALPAEGKTTAVVNLALAIADAGHTVTVVEGDLRKPKVTRYLGLVGGVGLTNLLAGTADIDDVVQRHGDGRVQVIAAGPTPPNPGELLASSHMAELLDKLRSRTDYVLIDAPPLLPVADTSGLAVHTDGVLLSLRYGSTRRDQLQQAAATLERVGARTLGVILNIVPPKAPAAAAVGYGYDYGYDEAPKHAMD
jgi:capsular exopolysaccharide synthesis family protein